jgi:hypothetical protein
MYLTTGRGAPMQLVAEATPFHMMYDVHLKPAGAYLVVWPRGRCRLTLAMRRGLLPLATLRKAHKSETIDSNTGGQLQSVAQKAVRWRR